MKGEKVFGQSGACRSGPVRGHRVYSVFPRCNSLFPPSPADLVRVRSRYEFLFTSPLPAPFPSPPDLPPSPCGPPS